MRKKIKWYQVIVISFLSFGLSVLLIPKDMYAQQRTVRGTVLYNPNMNDCLNVAPCVDDIELTHEEDWIPTPGAVNIVVKGTSIVAKTDRDGNYEIIIPSASDTLQFLYVSHNRIEIPVEGQNVLDVKLTPTPLPVIERLLAHIMPKVVEGIYPDLDKLAEDTGVNRATARDMVWLVLGNRRMSKYYPGEFYPDFDFEE